MTAIDKLITECDRRDLEWFLTSDRTKVTPEFRFECRVYERKDAEHRVRIIERGFSAYNAAAKALAEVERLPV